MRENTSKKSSSVHGLKLGPYCSARPSFQGISHSIAKNRVEQHSKPTSDAVDIRMRTKNISGQLTVDIVQLPLNVPKMRK